MEHKSDKCRKCQTRKSCELYNVDMCKESLHDATSSLIEKMGVVIIGVIFVLGFVLMTLNAIGVNPISCIS